MNGNMKHKQRNINKRDKEETERKIKYKKGR